MRRAALKFQKQVEALPDVEKLHLVDTLLSELDKPDQEIDKIWMEESRRRWKDYKSGKLQAVLYQDVMRRFRNK